MWLKIVKTKLDERGRQKLERQSSWRSVKHHHHHHHLSHNHEGCWDTTDHFTNSSLHSSLFSTALWNLANSRPDHSLMLSSHLFLCLPCLLPPFTVPSCKMVLARPDIWQTCPHHCSLRLFTMIRRSSRGLIACWTLARTSSLVTWSLHEMRSILQWHLISVACILLWSSAVRVHDSQANRKMDVGRVCISHSDECKPHHGALHTITQIPTHTRTDTFMCSPLLASFRSFCNSSTALVSSVILLLFSSADA